MLVIEIDTERFHADSMGHNESVIFTIAAPKRLIGRKPTFPEPLLGIMRHSKYVLNVYRPHGSGSAIQINYRTLYRKQVLGHCVKTLKAEMPAARIVTGWALLQSQLKEYGVERP